MKKTILFFLLAALLLCCLPIQALAATPKYTVNFYSDSSLTTLLDTQQVQMGNHPKAPTTPPSYTIDGYRYDFDGWYWEVGGVVQRFSLTEEDCEIWGDATIFAAYTKYLAEGYYLIVVHSGGAVYLEDTQTPVKTLLKGYSGITSAYTQSKSDYQQGSSGGDHEHSFDYTAPTWSWQTQSGATVAVATYTCSCQETQTETVPPTYTDRQGVRTYHAQDSHGNTAQQTKTLEYTLTLNGAARDAVYHWGDVCLLSADTVKAWYVGSVAPENLVADGVKSYVFAITDNTHIVTADTQHQTQQPTVRVEMRSESSGAAAFHAQWSVPYGAHVQSVTIYRGYTATEKTIDAQTLIDNGTPFTADLNVSSGDYTLHLTELTPGTWQHAAIVIQYSVGGVQQEPLVSAVAKAAIT